jgi:putative ABC transport system permease protein
MKIRDQFLFAFRAMTDRRLRTTLTIIGIVIGPATIVSLDAATLGYSNASTAQFNSLGANTLFLSASARGFSLTIADLSQIEALPGVASVLPYQMLSGTITQGGGSVSVQIIGTDLSNLTRVFPKLSVLAGSYPSSTDLAGAIVGNSVAYPDITDATNVTVNQVLSVSNVGRGFSFGPTFGTASNTASVGQASTKSFIVRGILNAYGTGFLISPDTAVFVPLAEGEALLHSYDYTGMMVVASSNSVVNNVDSELTALYGNDVRITSVSSLLSTITSVTQSTGTLLEAVGSISVLVAFIAIMTTEFTSVIERTKEIGILKALGATSRTIMFNFISEALATGFIGGLIGAALGSGLSFLIIGVLASSSRISGVPGSSTAARRIGGGGGGGVFFSSGGGGGFAAAAPAASPSTAAAPAITPALTPELILLAIALATIVGGLAGVLPAWRASKLPPVEALRTT